MRAFEYKHSDSWNDTFGGTYFVATYPADKEGNLKSMKSVNSCREFFTMKIQAAIRNKHEKAIKKAYALIINGRHASGSAALAATWLDKIKTGVIILNSFEKHYGIPLTKLHPVINKNWSGRAFAIGAKRWTHSRYSFGLWTLFFRLGQTEVCQPKLFLKLLPSMKWPEISDRIVNSSKGNSTLNQAKGIFPKIDAFFKFEKKYLKNRYDNWDPNHIHNGFQRPEGIYKLLTGTSYVPKFKEEWGKFYENYKKTV